MAEAGDAASMASGLLQSAAEDASGLGGNILHAVAEPLAQVSCSVKPAADLMASSVKLVLHSVQMSCLHDDVFSRDDSISAAAGATPVLRRVLLPACADVHDALPPGRLLRQVPLHHMLLILLCLAASHTSMHPKTALHNAVHHIQDADCSLVVDLRH